MYTSCYAPSVIIIRSTACSNTRLLENLFIYLFVGGALRAYMLYAPLELHAVESVGVLYVNHSSVIK